MPSFCVVSNCEHKYTHSENISFHKFPHHSQEILKKWINFTDRGVNWKPSKWSAICSRHFLPSDFRDLSARKCLKRNSIPSITMKQFNIDLLDLRCTNNYKLKSSKKNGLTSNCRLCGVLCKTIITFSNNSELYNMIKKCFPTVNIQQNDDLPKTLCENCLQKLNNFSNFIDTVILTQRDYEEKFLNNGQQGGQNNDNNNNISDGNGNTSERKFKIKQEPIIKIKQEISDITHATANVINYSNTNVSNEYCDDYVDHSNEEIINDNSIDQKSKVNTLLSITSSTSVLRTNSPQDIVNNCEIMEIISLDDAFIDIPDDDGDHINDHSIHSSQQIKLTSNNSRQVDLKINQRSKISNEWDHNYASKIILDVASTNNYKTEKIEENSENSINMTSNIDNDYNNKNSQGIIVLTERIVETIPIVKTNSVMYNLYLCSFCQMQFLSDKLLENHIKFQHIKENVAINYTSSTSNQNNENNNSQRSQQQHHVCSICNCPFSTICNLIKHKNKFHEKKFQKGIKNKKFNMTHSCENCDKIFLNKLALNNHRKYICIKRNVFECRYCYGKFNKWILLRKHEMNCRKQITNAKKCDTTIKINCSQMKIKSVPATMNDDGRYSCEKCGRCYTRRSNLYRHERKHRPVDQWNLKCGDCEVLFDRIYDLKQHLNTNECTGNSDGKQLEQILYVCTVCGKEFKTIQRLETHMAIHSNKKPYVCETCGKAFPCFNNLHQHRITHTDLRRYKCELCDKAFKRRGGLNQHKKAFHLKLKPFECPICKHCYTLKTDMLRCRHSNLRC